MTTILAFETATAACSAALWLDGEISQYFEVAPRRHGELLLPMIDRLLREARLTITDCDAIAFGHGPGSFMGLRIAAGVAQGLAFGANIPVIPVSTLQALAQTAFWGNDCETILAGWDARMNQIYWGIYKVKAGRMQSVVSDQLSMPSEVNVPDSNYMAVGNAWEVYADVLPAIKAMPRSEQDCYPSARAVAFFGAEAFDRGAAIDPQAIELAYLRNQVAVKPNR